MLPQYWELWLHVFCPFCFSRPIKKTPPLVLFLGRLLPPAVMGMLVVYSLKDVQLLSGTHGLPEALAIALLVALQLTLRNALVTIGVSTVFYMLLVQKIFI